MDEPKLARNPTRKRHSWWWDSHISPKNSRWLADNLQEMDKQVKEMLQIIEVDGDSFAMKAEMYYRRRPQLVLHVETFYRMYRALAERYDNVTGDLRSHIPSRLRPQGSAELKKPPLDPSTVSPQRAAGFEVFLGMGIGRSVSDVSPRRETLEFVLPRAVSEREVKREESTPAAADDDDIDEEEEEDGMVFTLEQRIVELEEELREANARVEELEEKYLHGAGEAEKAAAAAADEEIARRDAEEAVLQEALRALQERFDGEIARRDAEEAELRAALREERADRESVAGEHRAALAELEREKAAALKERETVAEWFAELQRLVGKGASVFRRLEPELPAPAAPPGDGEPQNDV